MMKKGIWFTIGMIICSLCSCDPSPSLNRIYQVGGEYTSGETVFRLADFDKESQSQENTYTVTFTFKISHVSSVDTIKTYFKDCFICNSGGATEDERTYLDEEETKAINGFDYENQIATSIKLVFTDFIFTDYNNEIDLQCLNSWTIEEFI